MKTQQEITQQAVEMTKKKPLGKVGRKQTRFTDEDRRASNIRSNRDLRAKNNALVIHYRRLENKEENDKMKKAVVSHFRRLLGVFIKEYEKSIAL